MQLLPLLFALIALAPACAADRAEPDGAAADASDDAALRDVLMDADRQEDASDSDLPEDTTAPDTTRADTLSADTEQTDTAETDTAEDSGRPTDADLEACGGRCVGQEPGWDGPWRVWVATFDPDATGAPNGCPASSTAQRYFRQPAGPPDCAPCGCDFSESECAPPRLRCELRDDTCDDVEDITDEVAAGCYAFTPPTNGLLSCVADPAEFEGRCTATGGEQAPEDPWGVMVELCPAGSSSSGCDAGEVCTDDSSPLPLCISQVGQHTCPEGWVTEEALTYTNPRDNRSCQGCTCVDSDVTCDGADTSYAIHQTGDCLDFGPYPRVPTSGECAAFDSLDEDRNFWSIRRINPGTPACPEMTSQPQGSVSGDVVTVCCLDD